MNPFVNLVVLIAVVVILMVLLRPNQGLVALLRQHRHLNARVLREDALKYLAKREASSSPASVAAVAGSLGVTTDRASAIVDEMIRAGQADRTETGIVITARGRETALHLIRAHRLWELFLAEKTGYERAEWHSRADEQEHLLDSNAVRDLEGRLGNPVVDPDGDPIPRETSGRQIASGGTPLADLSVGTTGRIVHLEDEPASVYAELVAQELYPGLPIEVLEANRERVRFWAGHREGALSPRSIEAPERTRRRTAYGKRLLRCERSRRRRFSFERSHREFGL